VVVPAPAVQGKPESGLFNSDGKQRNGLHPLAILRHQKCQFFRPTRSGYYAVAGGQRRLDDVVSKNAINFANCRSCQSQISLFPSASTHSECCIRQA
jgi:hypothetical protein